MRSRHVLAPIFLSMAFSCASTAGLPSWARGLVGQLRCGMSLQDVQSLTPMTLNSLGGERPWLGMHYFRRGGTDLWLQFDDRHLQSFVVARVNGLSTVRLSPKNNLCTGTLSYRLRIYLPEESAGACVFLDGVRVSCSKELLRDVEMPGGEHEIRIDVNGFLPIVKRYRNDPESRGDVELRIDARAMSPAPNSA